MAEVAKLSDRCEQQCSIRLQCLRPEVPLFVDIVCADDADVILCSSDEVVFKVHRKNLTAHSEIFGVADTISPGNSPVNEVVTLDEPSAVLDLLLQYMYTEYQPVLREVDFKTLAGVAEAAEKYQVSWAIRSLCRTEMW